MPANNIRTVDFFLSNDEWKALGQIVSEEGGNDGSVREGAILYCPVSEGVRKFKSSPLADPSVKGLNYDSSVAEKEVMAWPFI